MAVAAAAGAFLMHGPVHAQEGTWTAQFITPAGEPVAASYVVERSGNALRAVMEFAGGRMTLTDYRLEGDLLSFVMNAGFPMECRFERNAGRQYHGSCKDGQGYIGPAAAAPPGVALGADEIDLEAAFKVWGTTMEEYEEGHLAGKTTEPVVPEPLPSRMVEVDGGRINLVDIGAGDATVVLVSGVGDDHQVWRTVQEALGARMRVVSYDRAGLGLSEASADARSPENIARELHAMLVAAAIAPPFILVGHEFGGLVTLRYSMLYPEEIAGFVLVDPALDGLDDAWKQIDAGSWEEYVQRRKDFFSLASETASREFQALVDALESDTASYGGGTSVPAVVISGRRHNGKASWVGVTPEGLRAKSEVHEDLAGRLQAEFMVSDASSGNIHMEDAAVVVEAVERVFGLTSQ